MKNKIKIEKMEDIKIHKVEETSSILGDLDTDKSPLILIASIPENGITFVIEGKEVLQLSVNGDIYVNRKLVENDKEVVEGMREFLLKAQSFL